MTKLMTVDDVRKLIKAECVKLGSQSAFATLVGCDRRFVSMVLNGHSLPPKRMCEAVGVVDVGPRYRKR